MNRKGLKKAAKQCLQDANESPRKLTLLYLLCIYGLLVLYNVMDYYLGQNLGSGLSALGSRRQYDFFSTAAYVALLVLNLLWTTHYCNYSLKLSRGQQTSFRDFLEPFSLAATVLAVNFLCFLYIYCWCLLFLIPGIVAAYRYRLSKYIMFDRHCSASEAIRESKRLTRGHKLELFQLDLSFFWYYILMMLPNVVTMLDLYGIIDLSEAQSLLYYLVSVVFIIAVSVWKMPYVEATYAHAYQFILSQDAHLTQQA